MNLRRKAAETLDSVGTASSSVQTAAELQTIVLTLASLGIIIAIGVGVAALLGARIPTE